MARREAQIERLLTPAEVADLLGVDTRTVARWARAGRLPALRTLGGHRRFRERDVRSHLPDLGRLSGPAV